MKILVDKLPQKSSDCLFCEVKEDITSCMIGTNFESIYKYKFYCKCEVENGEKCPYLKEFERNEEHDMSNRADKECFISNGETYPLCKGKGE